jgi:hypothetical protein
MHKKRLQNRSPERMFVDFCDTFQAGAVCNGPGPNFSRKPDQNRPRGLPSSRSLISAAIFKPEPVVTVPGPLVAGSRPKTDQDKSFDLSLGYAIELPGRKSGFRARFLPDTRRESIQIGPPAGLRPAGGHGSRGNSQGGEPGVKKCGPSANPFNPIVLPGRSWGFRSGFRPDANRQKPLRDPLVLTLQRRN